MLRHCLLLAALPLCLFGAFGVADDAETPTSTLRRPIELLRVGDKLVVVERNRIVVLNPATQQVENEVKTGRKNSAAASTPDGKQIVIADEEANEVVAFEFTSGQPREFARRKVGMTPVGIQLHPDGRRASVSCLWPRQTWLIDLKIDGSPTKIDLPFAPRQQLLSPDGTKLIVADAFAGKIALVDFERRVLESVRDLADVHNIRGFAWSRDGKGLWLTHQILHSQGHPNPGEIRAGSVVSNHLRKLSKATVLDARTDLLRDELIYSLGDIERGAGDPAALAELGDGRLLITLAGINEFLIGRPERVLWNRVDVGRRPTALVVEENRQRAYVANTFDDSISVIDLRMSKVEATIPLGPLRKSSSPEERGEIAFFDARHSLDGWYSCHSCHTDGHTSGRLNDNFTDGSFGTPKRVLTLRGVKDTGPWAWSGQMADLETQVRNSLRSTMQGPTPSKELVADLTAYLRSLPPAPSVLEARGTIDADAFKRGRKIFTREKCASCHSPPTYTTPKTYDVGLRDEVGGTHFNPPSLRGVSQGGPFFHDNRAATLEDVFRRYRHQLAGKLTEQELQDLLHFLRSL
jgi:YVTN family beta-propeller protein